MTVLWNANLSGFRMTGLNLRGGSLFIGLSKNTFQVQDGSPAKGHWLSADSGWTKTGFSGAGGRWFFGIACASSDRTMTPKTVHAAESSPFELYRLSRQGS